MAWLGKGKTVLPKRVFMFPSLTQPSLIQTKFDLVTAFRLLLNAQEDLRRHALRTIRAVLAEDGLLVVETSHMDLHASDEALDDLIRQIRTMKRGTRYYVPRA